LSRKKIHIVFIENKKPPIMPKRKYMEDIRKGLGKRIRTLRKLKVLTQEELGEKAGLSYKFVGEIERGEVNPSLDSLERIATALDIKVGDLFPREVDIFPQFSPQDLQLIKKALRILNRTFSKV
jgi:transcriptional regulator with XRE-family HTH domain